MSSFFNNPKSLLLLLVLFLPWYHCFAQQVTRVVNPFIGTASGLTFPGPSAPFGLVQLSPDTRSGNTASGSGYQYADSVIVGFSHLHTSGADFSETGDILLMPGTGPLLVSPERYGLKDAAYASLFSHKDEFASPGFYSVFLSTYGIKAELTSTERVGFHRYTFSRRDNMHILLDLDHAFGAGTLHEAAIQVIDRTTAKGYKLIRSAGLTKKVWFTLQFFKPFKSSLLYAGDHLQRRLKNLSGNAVKAEFIFKGGSSQELLVKVALSLVDQAGADANMTAELPGWNFDSLKNQAASNWEQHLSQAKATGDAEPVKAVFYTALYHSLLSPTLDCDADRRYRGVDGDVHLADFSHYSLYSYAADMTVNYSLLGMFEPAKMPDFFKSFLATQQEQTTAKGSQRDISDSGLSPYHLVTAFADAAFKDLLSPVLTAQLYREFIREAHEGSVAATLAFAVDDLNLTKIARVLHKAEDVRFLLRRSALYKNLIYRNTPVPSKAVALISFPWNPGSRNYQADVAEIAFIQGNRVSDDFLKRQKEASEAAGLLFSAGPDGLPAVGLSGAVSAWYVFNAAGLNQFNAADEVFYLSKPRFKRISLPASAKARFSVECNVNPSADMAVTAVALNNQYLKSMYMPVRNLANGALIQFKLMPSSNRRVSSLSHSNGMKTRKIHTKGKKTALSP